MLAEMTHDKTNKHFFDQEEPHTYVGLDGNDIEGRPATAEAAVAEVIAFPGEFDETNLPLLEQYKRDWAGLSEKAKRNLVVGVTASALLLSYLGTGGGVTLPQNAMSRVHQIEHIFK